MVYVAGALPKTLKVRPSKDIEDTDSIRDDILNKCIDKLFRGESMEGCLDQYPKCTFKLKPLLSTVRIARNAAMVQPRAGFKAALKERLTQK